MVPLGSHEPEPLRVTGVPTGAVWSCPAEATGIPESVVLVDVLVDVVVVVPALHAVVTALFQSLRPERTPCVSTASTA